MMKFDGIPITLLTLWLKEQEQKIAQKKMCDDINNNLFEEVKNE